MSIFDKIQQRASITEGSRALELFTDRYSFIRRFLRYLNEDPAQAKVLFLYGEGGSGKSLLLRFLREYACKRLKPQDNIWAANLPDDQLVPFLKQAQNYERVPSAYMDFGMPPRGDERPQEAFYALLTLRRLLGNQGLHFPLYDFASIWYMHKLGVVDTERIKSLFPGEDLDLVTTIIDTISSTSWSALSKAIFVLFNKRVKVNERLTMFMHRRNLTEKQVRDIQHMDPKGELLNELPRLFAEDLSTTMLLPGALKRIVLFFDTHEAFWGQPQEVSDYLYFERDEWLRGLLRTLELQAGVIVVIAGRVPPRWSQAARYHIPDDLLDLQHVGNLPENDALTYLHTAGVEDLKTRQALVAYASVEPGQAHPLSLGLGADTVIASAARKVRVSAADLLPGRTLTDRGKVLVDLLLRNVDKDTEYAVRALSATRAFNRDLYFRLGNALRFRASDASFHNLIQFSFVWHARQTGDGWFRIHPLLRRIIQQREDDVVKEADSALYEADAALETYYRARVAAGEDLLIAEAIYHRNRQDWNAAIDEWTEIFVDGINYTKLPLCNALMEVRSELHIRSGSQRAFVAYLEAEYLSMVAHYDEAAGRYREAILLSDGALRDNPGDRRLAVLRAKMLKNHAELQIQRSDIDVAATLLSQAEDWVDSVLAENPAFEYALDAKAGIYTTQMHLQARLGQYEAVVNTHRLLVPVLERLQQLGSYLYTPTIDSALALSDVAEAQVARSQFPEARASCELALTQLEQALAHASAEKKSRICEAQGHIYLRLGKIEKQFSNFELAARHFASAITRFEGTLSDKHEDMEAQKFLGVAVLGLGACQAEIGNLNDAIDSYTKGLNSFDRMLEIAPDHVEARANRLVALVAVGRVLELQKRYEDALDNYGRAVNAAQAMVAQEPQNGYARGNNAAALVGMGQVYSALAQEDKAAGYFEAALAEYELATQNVAPDPEVFIAKATTLARLGDWYTSLGQLGQAFRYYERALMDSETAVSGMPNSYQARVNRVASLLRVGEMRLRRVQRDRACHCFQHALQDSEWLLSNAPVETKPSVTETIAFLRALLDEYCGC